MRPNFGHIEDIPPIVLSLGRVHDLDIDIPDRVVAFLNGLVEILDQVVGILAADLGRFFSGHVFHAKGGLDMDFDVFKRSILYV